MVDYQDLAARGLDYSRGQLCKGKLSLIIPSPRYDSEQLTQLLHLNVVHYEKLGMGEGSWVNGQIGLLS